MNPIVAGRVEGLLLASLLIQNCSNLDPTLSMELAHAMDVAAVQVASTDLLQRFTITPGIVAELQVHP